MRLVAPFLLILSLGSSLAGQTPPPTQEPPPQFRAEVAAVVVDVLVLDAEGRPAEGLGREDFQVYEDGVLQTIESFEVIDWTSYVRRDVPRPGETPLPATGQVNAFPRRFIFVLNRQGAKFGYLVRARKALENFLVESMAEGDEAMVLDIGLSTRVLQEFRDSKEETLRTVRKLSAMEVEVNPGFPIGRAGFGLEERATRNVYDSLEALGDALRGFSGRKIVILLSPELNRTYDLITYLQSTVNALNRSNTTVYSIDIRGVETVSADQSAPRSTPFADDVDAGQVSSTDSFDIGGLFPLANETGGRYFYNLNVFEPAVDRIGQENRRYYVLSYVPTNTALDGKFRKIEVRVGRPELKVVARRGYLARKEKPSKEASKQKAPPAPPAPPSPARPPAPVAAAATTPRPNVPTAPRPPAQLEISTYLLPGGEGKVEVPIAVALPLDLLESKELGGGQATLKLALKDGSGRIVESLQDAVDRENFYLVRVAKLSAGSYLLGVSLESEGKTVYQAHEQIEVPGEMGKRFGLSSLVPVFAPTSSGGEARAEQLAVRPMPTLNRGEDALLFFRIFPGEGTALSEEGTEIEFSIHRGQEEIRSLGSRQPPKLVGDGALGYPILIRVPTADLPAGRYRVELRVSNSKLGRRATGEIELSLQ